MSYPITRVIVKDTPPPREVISVGRIFAIVEKPEPETVFTTVGIEDEKSTETKVVKRGRRPAPKANEAAETK